MSRPLGRPRVEPAVRFWKRVEKTDTCWLWTGCTDKDGYGVLSGERSSGKSPQIRAHRFAYELLVGPIPAGLTLDHVRARGCTSRLCVNPAHLEPVTNVENVLRGDSPAALARRRSTCSRGHEYTPENTTLTPTGRRCRTCARARWHQWNRGRQAREVAQVAGNGGAA